MGTTTENLMGSDSLTEDNLSQSSLYISPETAIRDYKKNAHHDLVVECLISHPELGADFVSYTHMVEVLCKSNIDLPSFLKYKSAKKHYIRKVGIRDQRVIF